MSKASNEKLRCNLDWISELAGETKFLTAQGRNTLERKELELRQALSELAEFRKQKAP